MVAASPPLITKTSPVLPLLPPQTPSHLGWIYWLLFIPERTWCGFQLENLEPAGEDDDPGTQNPPKAQEKPNYFFQSRPEVSHELSEATSSAGGDQNSFTSLPLLFFILVWSVRTTSIPQPGCSSSSPQQANIDNQLKAPEMFGRSFFVPLLSLSARITPRNGDARAALMR